MAVTKKRFVVYDTKHKVYNQGRESMTGLNMRMWGYDKAMAERLTKREADAVVKAKPNCEVQEL